MKCDYFLILCLIPFNTPFPVNGALTLACDLLLYNIHICLEQGEHLEKVKHAFYGVLYLVTYISVCCSHEKSRVSFFKEIAKKSDSCRSLGYIIKKYMKVFISFL